MDPFLILIPILEKQPAVGGRLKPRERSGATPLHRLWPAGANKQQVLKDALLLPPARRN